MYKTCMFCNKPLGGNEVVETFPVGRRLAFDAAKGRLWVVCRKCERWNLTPLEERWEAVETCEKLFRGTKVRVSSDNIGLARHPEGLELVRIGKPMRPEFAAWRYGDQFGRRRRRQVLYGAGSVAAVGTVAAGGVLAGGGIMFVFGLAGHIENLYKLSSGIRRPIKLGGEYGKVLELRHMDILSTRLLAEDGEPGFGIEVLYKGRKKKRFSGEDAARAAARIVPRINETGGTKKTVQRAVDDIEALGHPSRYLAGIASADWKKTGGVLGVISRMPKPVRLALEMSLHEEQERRAMEGELWLLERAWKESEEIAAISDKLFLPQRAEDLLEHHKQAGKPGREGAICPDMTRASE